MNETALIVLFSFLFFPETIMDSLAMFGALNSFPLFVAYIAMATATRPITRLVGPYELRVPLIIHNAVCCLLSMAVVVLGGIGLALTDSVLKIQPGNSLVVLSLQLYWISKIVELLDTVFMLLRHRKRQITFLHVFHHSSMLLLSDYSYFLSTWPPIAIVGVLNSFVHIVMYGYYAMTAWHPMEAYTWKKCITQLQMIQFLIGIVIGTYGYLTLGYCVYSIVYPMSMFALFSNYYYHAYINPKPKKTMQKKE